MEHRKLISAGLVVAAVLVVLSALWGPEVLAGYKDRATLNHIIVEQVEGGSEGYRYVLNSNEKLFILAKCLNNQVLPESEQSSKTRVESTEPVYEGIGEELTGAYAFVVNRQGPSGKEITDEEIYGICNREIDTLKELGILHKEVRTVDASAYSTVLYSAIDVLEPRNNMSVWKVSLSTSQQNADKNNRILDLYIDADTGKIYEFYVRTERKWSDTDPDDLVEKWSEYLELTGMEEYEADNPLLETTPYFKKYRFPGMETGNTVVTVGFYEGIDELFLKISK
ncbi:MAG: hypothetical protein J6C84_08615 [Lachnospiraceae bacterium]|nr:hypothetical protein [Lachnospiraceae bacterium]